MATREPRRRAGGFTLIEVLIAVVIVGVLAAIAYPTYVDTVHKSRRSDAKSALHSLANALERYRIRNNGSYAGATLGNGAGDVYPASTPEGNYTLAFGDSDGDASVADEPTAAGYLVIATATDSQTQDTTCRRFTLNQAGTATATDSDGAASTDDCW